MPPNPRIHRITIERQHVCECIDVTGPADLQAKLKERDATYFILQVLSHTDTLSIESPDWTPVQNLTQQDFEWLTQDTNGAHRSLNYAISRDWVPGHHNG